MGGDRGTGWRQSAAHRHHGDPQLSEVQGATRRSDRWRTLAAAVLGVAVVALGARLSIAMPATPVPQSAQTLGVLLVGGWLGPKWGPFSLLLYLFAGACGLPVFADGASGPGVLAGPTAGYLVGFVVAAWWMGRCRGRAEGYSQWVLAGVIAHAMVLGCGWFRLASSIGAASAFESGVQPFLLGGLWKSLAAAMVLSARDRVRRRRVGP